MNYDDDDDDDGFLNVLIAAQTMFFCDESKQEKQIKSQSTSLIYCTTFL